MTCKGMFFTKINLIIFFLITTQTFAFNVTSESLVFLNSLKGSTKEAYEYAIENPEILDNFSCYCGCEKIKHTSNKSCFIKDIDKTNNKITLTSHSVNCPICIDVALTVKYLSKDGFTFKEIKQLLDDAYKDYPSTNTELKNNDECCSEKS